MVHASGEDAPRALPVGSVLGLPNREKTTKTQDTLDRLYLPAGLGTPWCTPGSVGGGRQREVWGPLL